MGDNKVQHELHQPAAVELLISTAQPPLIIEHTTENSRYDGRNSIYNARRPDTETVKISFFTQEVCDSYDELVDVTTQAWVGSQVWPPLTKVQVKRALLTRVQVMMTRVWVVLNHVTLVQVMMMT